MPNSKHHCKVSANLSNLQTGDIKKFYVLRITINNYFTFNSIYPLRCPSSFSIPILLAYLLFPSIIIATCFGTLPVLSILTTRVCNQLNVFFVIHDIIEITFFYNLFQETYVQQYTCLKINIFFFKKDRKKF